MFCGNFFSRNGEGKILENVGVFKVSSCSRFSCNILNLRSNKMMRIFFSIWDERFIKGTSFFQTCNGSILGRSLAFRRDAFWIWSKLGDWNKNQIFRRRNYFIVVEINNSYRDSRNFKNCCLSAFHKLFVFKEPWQWEFIFVSYITLKIWTSEFHFIIKEEFPQLKKPTIRKKNLHIFIIFFSVR